MQTYYPLKNGWRINEDMGNVPDQIKDRVNSEDWYTQCKGYPLIQTKDITGKLGQPLLE